VAAFPEASALALAIATEAESVLILADRAFYSGHLSSVALPADEHRANCELALFVAVVAADPVSLVAAVRAVT